MLYKIELFVAGRSPKIVAPDDGRLALVRAIAAILFALASAQAQAALAPKRRIGRAPCQSTTLFRPIYYILLVK